MAAPIIAYTRTLGVDKVQRFASGNDEHYITMKGLPPFPDTKEDLVEWKEVVAIIPRIRLTSCDKEEL